MSWRLALPRGNRAQEIPNNLHALAEEAALDTPPSHNPCSAVPDGVGQGQDPQHKEIHGKQEIDVLL